MTAAYHKIIKACLLLHYNDIPTIIDERIVTVETMSSEERVAAVKRYYRSGITYLTYIQDGVSPSAAKYHSDRFVKDVVKLCRKFNTENDKMALLR